MGPEATADQISDPAISTSQEAIDDIRNRTVNMTLFTLAGAGLVMVTAFFAQIPAVGWRSDIHFQVMLWSVVIACALLYRQVSLQLRAAVVLGALSLFGVNALMAWELSGPGMMSLAMAVLFATVLFGARVGFMFLGLAVSIVGGLGGMIALGINPFWVSPGVAQGLPTNLVLILISVTGFMGMAISGLGVFRQAWLASVRSQYMPAKEIPPVDVEAGEHFDLPVSKTAITEEEKVLLEGIESINDGFVLWGTDNRMVFCNSRYRDLHPKLAHLMIPGVAFEDLLRRSVILGQYQIEGSPESWIADQLNAFSSSHASFEQQLDDGRWLMITKHRTAAGGVVGIRTDVTDIKEAEQRIRFRANYDPLTELPNRAHFMEQFDQILARSKRSKKIKVALLFIDLDRFKNVNDTLGHAAGDVLLKEAARRIKQSVRSTDVVARLGGDEFTVILPDLSDEIHATLVAETILEKLARAYEVNDQELYCGASIGITVFPSDSEGLENLLRNADMAMYQAKEAGRNTYRYFFTEMTERAHRFVELEADLRAALSRDEFIVRFQPVYSIRNKSKKDPGECELVGAEALLIRNHPTRGLIMPEDFLDVAEETGLIVEIGEWVLRTACEQARDWPLPESGKPLTLSVNVSSRQFQGGFNDEVVASVLADTRFPADRLILEITESLLMKEDPAVHEILDKLRAMGIRLSIDDFGTGYSSLGYLRRFPVSVLKVDRSFVQDMITDHGTERLVETIVAMARGMDMKVVAEGVEKVEQLALLKKLRCDMVQGFLLGKPEMTEEFAATIARGNWRSLCPESQVRQA